MNAWLAPDPVVVALIGLAVLSALLLALRHARRHRWWIVALQLPCAALLLAALLLRDDTGATALVVLTTGADPQSVPQTAASWPTVVLPGGPATEAAERLPDLATALRRFPAVTHVHVIGTGLAEHDREALGTRALSFALPSDTIATTITELDAPASVRAGAWWTVRGRVTNAAKHTIELRDPADRVIATTTPDEHGDFTLQAVSRANGPVLFSVRLLDGERVLQSIPLPIDARPTLTVRALLLAAAPSPELKFLRRWALDAGVDFASRIALSPGIAQRRGAPVVDAATLAQLDLLIVDERSWPQIASQEALRDAIGNGLGLLIRITGPVPDRVLRDWKALGIEPVFAAPKPRTVRLSGAGLPDKGNDDLHAWPVALHGDGHVALLRDSEGTPLAVWHVLGRGRIGAWWLSDSHRLATRGARETFATLWSNAVSTLARARGETLPVLPQRAVVGQRAVLCAPSGAMRVIASDGTETTPLRDPPQGECAAFWPTQAGWHRLEVDVAGDPDVADAASASSQDFHVFTRQDVASLLDHDTRQATAAMANRNDLPDGRRFDRDMLRAALLLAWLSLSALLWHLERRARRRD